MSRRSSVPHARLAPLALTVLCLGAWLAPAPPSSAEPPADSLAGLEDTILARVGSRVIAPASFLATWNRMPISDRPRGDSPREAYRAFLDDLITRDLLAVEAERHPRPLLPGQETELRVAREQLLKNELYFQEVYEAVPLDTVDLGLFRQEMTRILFLRAFVFQSEQAARAWYTRLVSGTPVSRLEALAKKESAARPRLVELGYQPREEFPDSVARVVFRLAPGQVGRPVAHSGAWWLYQVTNIRMRPCSINLEDPAAVLKEARRVRSEEAREHYRVSLAKELGLAHRMAAIDTLVHRFELLPPRVTRTPEGVNQMNAILPLPAFSSADSALVVATTVDGEVTGRDLLRYLAAQTPILRPEPRNRGQLMAVVDRVAFDAELLRRAERLGLERRPQVLETLARKRERFAVEFLYADSVSARVEAPEDSLRARFRADSTRYKVPESARLWMCAVERQSLADSVLEMARGGADLATLARTYSILEGARESGGEGRAVARGQGSDPNLDDLVHRTPVGGFGGPLEVPEGWLVFRVQERTPEVPRSYAEASSDVTAEYRRDEEERLMRAFLARLRARTRVESYPERLDRLGSEDSR